MHLDSLNTQDRYQSVIYKHIVFRFTGKIVEHTPSTCFDEPCYLAHFEVCPIYTHKEIAKACKGWIKTLRFDPSTKLIQDDYFKLKA